MAVGLRRRDVGDRLGDAVGERLDRGVRQHGRVRDVVVRREGLNG